MGRNYDENLMSYICIFIAISILDDNYVDSLWLRTTSDVIKFACHRLRVNKRYIATNVVSAMPLCIRHSTTLMTFIRIYTETRWVEFVLLLSDAYTYWWIEQHTCVRIRSLAHIGHTDRQTSLPHVLPHVARLWVKKRQMTMHTQVRGQGAPPNTGMT